MMQQQLTADIDPCWPHTPTTTSIHAPLPAAGELHGKVFERVANLMQLCNYHIAAELGEHDVAPHVLPTLQLADEVLLEFEPYGAMSRVGPQTCAALKSALSSSHLCASHASAAATVCITC
jgi:hypothetical protein